MIFKVLTLSLPHGNIIVALPGANDVTAFEKLSINMSLEHSRSVCVYTNYIPFS